jgi:hypothetical protein
VPSPHLRQHNLIIVTKLYSIAQFIVTCATVDGARVNLLISEIALKCGSEKVSMWRGKPYRMLGAVKRGTKDRYVTLRLRLQ